MQACRLGLPQMLSSVISKRDGTIPIDLSWLLPRSRMRIFLSCVMAGSRSANLVGVDMREDICVGMCTSMCMAMFAGTYINKFIDMYVDMYANVRTDTFLGCVVAGSGSAYPVGVDMRVGMCVDVGVEMCVEMCV